MKNKNMKLLVLALICLTITTPALAQGRRRQAQYNCVTPENYYGTCTALGFCPQVVNAFQSNNPQSRQYVIALQRSCGNSRINSDPVVCCTRPAANQSARPQPQTRPVVTQRPNPFLPTQTTTVLTTAPLPQTTQRISVTTPLTTTPLTTTPTIQTRSGQYCRGPDLREGICVGLPSCEELVRELYAKQNDPTFANFLRASNSVCGGAGSTICCPTAGGSRSTTSAPVRIVNSNEIPRRPLTVQEGCGYTKNSYKKIVGGEVSKKGAWPWVALLGYTGFGDSPFKCGGTLVTARHVVTAAHCIRRDLSFVRLGEHDLTTDAEARHVDVKVARTEVHPQYNTRNGRSDVAVIYLDRNVQFTDNISPICLPSSRDLQTKSYVSYTPFVVGWGKTMEGGVSANVLQELQIPIYNNQVCKESYRKQNRLLSEDQFDSAVLCAGVLSGGKDTCQGDSGGPLMIPEPYQNNVRYYLIGVVSYGIGCARPQVPGVYASVQHFVNWILAKIADTH